MCTEKQYVLPVFSKSDKYLGSVTYLRVIEGLNSLERPPVNVRIENIISDNATEEGKQVFLRELRHNTKNPIQVIFSSLNMMKTTMNEKEKWLLMQSIESSTRQIDMVINQLYNEYAKMNEDRTINN
jgi:predicted transcriptional regulator